MPSKTKNQGATQAPQKNALFCDFETYFPKSQISQTTVVVVVIAGRQNQIMKIERKTGDRPLPPPHLYERSSASKKKWTHQWEENNIPERFFFSYRKSRYFSRPTLTNSEASLCPNSTPIYFFPAMPQVRTGARQEQLFSRHIWYLVRDFSQ